MLFGEAKEDLAWGSAHDAIVEAHDLEKAYAQHQPRATGPGGVHPMAVWVRQHPEAADCFPQRAGSHTHPREIVGGEVDRNQSLRFLPIKAIVAPHSYSGHHQHSSNFRKNSNRFSCHGTVCRLL